VCIWLTGPSGAGKSTLTASLLPLLESTGAKVTVLDVVPELRKLRGERTSRGKLIRKAFVAKEVVRHGGVVVCVTISSKREIRELARSMVGADSFVEVFVDAPADVVAGRKAARPKRPALRKRVRRSLKSVTARFGLAGEGGYEPSPHPDVHVETTRVTPNEGAELVMAALVNKGKMSWEPTDERRRS
jgi:adenylylsulfate kinase-like enzyme